MPDRRLTSEILLQIKDSIDKVLRRFSAVKSVEDFTRSEEGQEKLDSICMQLIVIGESIKKIDKIEGGRFFSCYDNDTDWRGIKGMRDVITHHYFDVDAEIVYDVCKTHLPKLKSTINGILSELERDSE